MEIPINGGNALVDQLRRVSPYQNGVVAAVVAPGTPPISAPIAINALAAAAAAGSTPTTESVAAGPFNPTAAAALTQAMAAMQVCYGMGLAFPLTFRGRLPILP